MSKIKILLRSEYSPDVAKAVAEALQGDNEGNGVARVATDLKGAQVLSEIEAESLEKALSVADDLLFCQSICEKTLSLVEKT